MTIYYVAKTGDDLNPGTDHAAPKLTIASAVTRAYAGTDNIVEIIDSGQYDEGDIDIFTNPITVRATGSNSPILDGDSGGDNYAFVPFISGNVFQGLTMRNYDDGLINTGFSSNALSFMLSGCIGHFLGGPQLIGNTSQHAQIMDCKILSDGNAALSCGDGKVWINNSIIASNEPGINVIKSNTSYLDITASFCTFIGSGYNNSSERNYHLVDQVYKVINCIVSGSGDGINANDSTYNLVNVSGDPFITWTADNWDGTPRAAHSTEISGDPLFVSGSIPGNVDPAIAGNVSFDTQDYSLSNGTPASAEGVGYNNVNVDIIAIERAIAPTIGAYEFTEIWTNYTSESDLRLDPDHLTSNRLMNLQDNQKYRILHNPQQVPFSRGVRGPATLRGRNTPYKVDK
jgi:hypothetical protein